MRLGVCGGRDRRRLHSPRAWNNGPSTAAARSDDIFSSFFLLCLAARRATHGWGTAAHVSWVRMQQQQQQRVLGPRCVCKATRTQRPELFQLASPTSNDEKRSRTSDRDATQQQAAVRCKTRAGRTRQMPQPLTRQRSCAHNRRQAGAQAASTGLPPLRASEMRRAVASSRGAVGRLALVSGTCLAAATGSQTTTARPITRRLTSPLLSKPCSSAPWAARRGWRHRGCSTSRPGPSRNYRPPLGHTIPRVAAR